MDNLKRFDIEQLHEQFINAKPFNYIVIDNFLNEDYLNDILEEVNGYENWLNNELNARGSDSGTILSNKKIGISDYNKFGSKVKEFFDFTNSKEMVDFLSGITGIPELLSDEHLFGGGLHRTSTGGHLSIHADFNIHPITQKYRRVNALLYLNKDWKPEYQGELELWEKDMSKCCHSIAPIFNRLVIFRITDDAYHGHPKPWEAPQNIHRLSFALYYYSNDRPEHEKSPAHAALWQKRLGIHY
jgi:Rps23 Pro-64 3,4-dihydroxylase Tpa1-like proline 4-hydroxylase